MSADQELRAVNEERLAAVKAGDIKKLDDMLAPDLISVSPNGAALGKTEMMADLKSGDFKIQEHRADDYRISLHGDTAVVSFRNNMTHFYKGVPRHGQYRVTSVYVKRSSRWMLVSQHVTAMPPQPPFPG